MAKTKKIVLGIKQIEVDEDYYPRMNTNWKVSYKYSQQMKTGANFPPVEVALIGNKYYLVDGKHRIDAHKMNKEKHVQCVINKDVNTFRQLYLLAIERNIAHGEPLTLQDKTKIALKLEKMNFSDVRISKIIGVPIKKFDKYMADRVTNTVTGKTVTLKPSVRHVVNQSEPVSEGIEIYQTKLGGSSQVVMLDGVIELIEQGLIDMNNKKVTDRVRLLKSLLRKVKV